MGFRCVCRHRLPATLLLETARGASVAPMGLEEAVERAHLGRPALEGLALSSPLFRMQAASVPLAIGVVVGSIIVVSLGDSAQE